MNYDKMDKCTNKSVKEDVFELSESLVDGINKHKIAIILDQLKDLNIGTSNIVLNNVIDIIGDSNKLYKVIFNNIDIFNFLIHLCSYVENRVVIFRLFDSLYDNIENPISLFMSISIVDLIKDNFRTNNNDLIYFTLQLILKFSKSRDSVKHFIYDHMLLSDIENIIMNDNSFTDIASTIIVNMCDFDIPVAHIDRLVSLLSEYIVQSYTFSSFKYDTLCNIVTSILKMEKSSGFYSRISLDERDSFDCALFYIFANTDNQYMLLLELCKYMTLLLTIYHMSYFKTMKTHGMYDLLNKFLLGDDLFKKDLAIKLIVHTLNVDESFLKLSQYYNIDFVNLIKNSRAYSKSSIAYLYLRVLMSCQGNIMLDMMNKEMIDETFAILDSSCNDISYLNEENQNYILICLLKKLQQSISAISPDIASYISNLLSEYNIE